MTSATLIRHPRRLAALAWVVLVAGCAGPAPPPPPPPPPVAAVVPPISLSPRVVEEASAYRAYVTHAGAISPAFADGGGVAQAVRTGAAYEPKQLLRGAIAYGAVAALQDAAFVAGVRKFVSNPDQRRTIAYEIMKDPTYAAGFSGSAGAASRVVAALADDGQRLLDTGRSVKQAAYDVQHAAWSKADVQDRETRLALAKQLSATATLGEMAETARLQRAVTGGAPFGQAAQTLVAPYPPLVVRSLAVAALAALGYADDTNLAQVMPMLSEVNSAQCLNMSKLNLYQCLAVAKPHYEDVFCVGQHILMDTGRCLMKGAGVIDILDAKAMAVAQAAALTQASAPVTTRPRSKKR